MDVPFPHLLLLTNFIPSSNVLTYTTFNTGPKISSLYPVISVETSIIVGPMKFPFGYFGCLNPLPSNKNFPPSFSTVPKI